MDNNYDSKKSLPLQNLIKVKVCGITRLKDVRAVLGLGADYVGLNLYPPSPRSISLQQAAKLLKAIPQGHRVLVDVAPATDKLKDYKKAGFDAFQIHFDAATTPVEVLNEWSQCVGPERLWLAPRLPSTTPLPAEMLRCATTFLIDTYVKNSYGGSGKTADWGSFCKRQASHRDKTFILAGGLSPINIKKALTKSQAHFVDVNSGVELSPGIKDPQKLQLLFQELSSFLENARSPQPLASDKRSHQR